MVTVVTAPETVEFPDDAIKIFLGGGIQKCEDWQQKIIKLFEKYETDDKIYLLNPRRENYPKHNPDATFEQIYWEFNMLEQCDFFTMLFLDSESDQPICFYELGRHLVRMEEKWPVSWPKRIVITCDSNFKRKEDVNIQTRLATKEYVQPTFSLTDKLIEEHFNKIIRVIS